MMEFLNELNESQRKAVEYIDGASLVIAGAGSGKTRVLTYKIAYLLKKGIHPTSVLALTFTNTAAREMKARIAAMVGEKTARYLWMRTFHSVFSRIRRAEADKTDFCHCNFLQLSFGTVASGPSSTNRLFYPQALSETLGIALLCLQLSSSPAEKISLFADAFMKATAPCF